MITEISREHANSLVSEKAWNFMHNGFFVTTWDDDGRRTVGPRVKTLDKKVRHYIWLEIIGVEQSRHYYLRTVADPLLI